MPCLGDRNLDAHAPGGCAFVLLYAFCPKRTYLLTALVFFCIGVSASPSIKLTPGRYRVT